MPDLNIAFWNVQNLFEPSVARRLGRGPRSRKEREAKLDRIAGVVGDFFGKRGPDLFAVAEVGTRTLFDELVDRLPGTRSPALRIWEAASLPEHTGLGIAARDDRIASLRLLDAWRPVTAARPRIIIVECDLVGAARPIWVVVNHWKSRMPRKDASALSDRQDRLDAAKWLGNRLGLAANMQCVIAVGDFNCQPSERPLNTLHLSGVRHSSTAIRSAKAASTLYNTAWRYTIEPDAWEHPRPPGYRASQPKTTAHCGGQSLVFDQLLVSKDALLGRPLNLHERSLTYHPDPRVFRYNANGQIRPLPWTGPRNGPFTGASDHLPLLATFTYA